MRRIAAALAFAVVATAAQAAGFQLTSSTFKPGAMLTNAQVYKGFGCEGDNISPQLSWSGVPKDAKSLALMVYDPDAPTGSGFWHWVVVNIPPTTTELPEGAGSTDGKLPEGALQTRTDFGAPGYGGPCPPKGDEPHRYIFTLYAIKTDKLDVDANTSAAVVGFMIHFNNAGKAVLTGKYGR
ncbi:MAG: YbhB/YbcL family Raf kinase inhibitor-like protein [Methylobacteriaceae bacterium]|nr:YbhB/YbcL family Raf kinase inhibitor-like protein [Methylobacteriaceae bacterium]MBV9705577.1 YbhB/YbcL family Raf kinase inhibitor-like protein [Methylobacteriaceae bacterium]